MMRLASDGCGVESRISLLGALMAALAVGTAGCHQAAMMSRPEPVTSTSAAADASERGEAASTEGRPGLGTVWGERRHSPVRNVSFARRSDGPDFLASLLYNDSEGAQVLRSRLGGRYRSDEPVFRSMSPSRSAPWGGVIIRVTDSDGQALPAYHLGERVLLLGAAGQRYAIEVENRTGQRFEVVASVDGLDVVDGRTASLDKHGYVIAPYGHLRIDGYRRSMEEVAAFRFGSVRDAYASQTAEFGDRHVGVIGVALFSEKGADPIPLRARRDDLDDDAARRALADPFPGRFAQPPQTVDYDD